MTTTWTLPDEPGPEVTAVRDRHGVKWLRQDGQWWSETPGLGTLRAWHVVLARGPLTDATNEAS